VTKLKFDPKTDYPKVIFSPEKWLEPADLAIVAKLSKSPEVLKLLSGTWSPVVKEDDEDAPALPPKKKAKAPVEDDEDAPAKPVKPVATPKNVEALLGEWDDD
jgi:hypothetical protein